MNLRKIVSNAFAIARVSIFTKSLMTIQDDLAIVEAGHNDEATKHRIAARDADARYCRSVAAAAQTRKFSKNIKNLIGA